tara:strand:- start:82 stop:951 length:870 start_codon:yes stop_codon:yes gene_type:complete
MKDMNILICGVGRMGNIHKKYVEQIGYNCFWYDPYIESNNPLRILDLEDIKKHNIGHIIISTPEGTHCEVYREIRLIDRDVKILIEKPAVVHKENFDIFDDKNLLVGLVERFNPAVEKLKSVIDKNLILNIDFIRCSISQSSNQRVSAFTDVGIHDIDLMFHLLQSQVSDFRVDHVSNTFSLITNHVKSEVMCRFLWSNETFSKERKIIVRQKNCTYEADLIDQTVKKYTSASDIFSTNINGTISENLYIEKSSSIKEQLSNLIRSDSIEVKGKESHGLYLDIKEKIEF